MRILSQDGNIDVNYDLVALVSCYKCKDGNGWFEIDMYSGALSAKNVRMAKYSTEAKARKAMEMLRNAYSPNIEIKEPIQKEMPKMRSGDWVWSMSEPRVEVLDNFYFQFPADDEVEV